MSFEKRRIRLNVAAVSTCFLLLLHVNSDNHAAATMPNISKINKRALPRFWISEVNRKAKLVRARAPPRGLGDLGIGRGPGGRPPGAKRP